MTIFLGHRGAVTAEGPYQNSLEAFKLAIKHAQGFEADACVTADQKIFLIHNSSGKSGVVEYTLNEHIDEQSKLIAAGRRIDQMHSDEVSKLKLKDGSAIVSLNKALDLIVNTDKVFNIELKDIGSAKAVALCLESYLSSGKLKPQQLMISSFSHEELRHIRKAFPEIEIGFLFESSDREPSLIAPWLEGCERLSQPLKAEYFRGDLFNELKPEWIVFPSFCLSDDLVTSVKALWPQIKLSAWVYSEIEKDPHKAALSIIKNSEKLKQLDCLIVDTPHLLP